MANTELQMNPHMEQIHGEIRDTMRAIANGFQKLDKIKDSSRQSKQLEELTGKMRECKRLIKEFDREIKDEESRNPPEATKELNDVKQNMIKELNSYVALRKTYTSTLGNKRVELFDMGAGASEPTADENVQMASAIRWIFCLDNSETIGYRLVLGWLLISCQLLLAWCNTFWKSVMYICLLFFYNLLYGLLML